MPKERRQKSEAKRPSVADDRTGPPVSLDDVAQRAYELYIQRGGEHGYDLDDWLQAERELRATRPE